MVRMGDIWDRTVEFVGDRLGTILPIAVLALLVPGAISGALAEVQKDAAATVALAIGVASIGLALVQLWGQLAIAALAADPALGGGAARVATARLLPTIGVYALVGLALVLLAVPLVAVTVASGVSVDQLRTGGAATALTPGSAGAIALTGLVLAVLALFGAARLMVLLPVLAIERRGAGSIARSRRLTRGMSWRLVGVVILYAIVVFVAMLAAQTVFGSLLRLLAGGSDDAVSIATVVTAIAVAAVTTGFTVMANGFMGRLYAALVARDGAVAAP